MAESFLCRSEMYHVNNRLSGGEPVFDQEEAAAAFVRDLNKLDRPLAGAKV